jgi:hypothetical protein
LRGFPNEGIWESEILYMACATRRFENTAKANADTGACEPFMLRKEKCDEEGGKGKNEIRNAVSSRNSPEIQTNITNYFPKYTSIT